METTPGVVVTGVLIKCKGDNTGCCSEKGVVLATGGAPFNNPAALGERGRPTPPPLDPPPPHPPQQPLERLGPIFFRAFGRSKNFSGAFSAN